MSKTYRIVIAIIVVIAIGAVIVSSRPGAKPVSTLPGTDTIASMPASTATTTTTTTTITTTTVTSPTFFALADIAAHNSAASCWTAINGSVYDVTSWIGNHPGGSKVILSLCGTDGSPAFDDQHGGQRRPNQELARFRIGDLR